MRSFGIQLDLLLSPAGFLGDKSEFFIFPGNFRNRSDFLDRATDFLSTGEIVGSREKFVQAGQNTAKFFIICSDLLKSGMILVGHARVFQFLACFYRL